MRRFILFGTACALVALASFATSAYAQAPAPVTEGGVRYTRFHLPGEATKEIVLMGEAQSGIYVIGESIALDKFLALTGFSFFEREADNVEVEKTVRVLRQQGDTRAVVYEARASDMLVQPGTYPVLQDKDIVAIEVKVNRGFDYRQVLQLASQLGTLTLLGFRLYDTFNR